MWCALTVDTVVTFSAEEVGTVDVTVRVAGCQPGEIIEADAKLCRICPAGRFSFDPENSICDNCPEGNICWFILISTFL